MGSVRNDKECQEYRVFVVVFALRRELDLLVSGFRILEDFAFVIPG